MSLTSALEALYISHQMAIATFCGDRWISVIAKIFTTRQRAHYVLSARWRLLPPRNEQRQRGANGRRGDASANANANTDLKHEFQHEHAAPFYAATNRPTAGAV